MKAIQMTKVGAPEVLQIGDVEEPRIETDSQLKVRLKAAGVNPIDQTYKTASQDCAASPAGGA
jgi:NADPH2:quinone reductase